MRSNVCVASGTQGGLSGAKSPHSGVRGRCPREKIVCLGKRVTYLGGFSAHGFFADGFLFSVKELRLLINLGHWVRVLDAT
jgi:hypothetical protein